MFLVKVNHLHALPVLFPNHAEVIDAFFDVFDAELVGHLDSRAFIHQEVNGERNIAFLIAFPLEHGFEKRCLRGLGLLELHKGIDQRVCHYTFFKVVVGRFT